MNPKLKELLEENEKFAEANEGLLTAKVEVTGKALGLLLQQLNEGIKQLFEGMASAENFDKTLGDKIQETVSKAITAFTQVKHEINFEPKINLDLAPIQSEISKSTQQSKLLYGLIEKFSNSTGKHEELFRLIMLLGQKQAEVFEKLSNMADIRPELVEINKTLIKPKEWSATIKVTKRDREKGWFEEADIKSKSV